MVPRLVKKFTAFYGTWRFVPCSQEPTSCPYPAYDPSHHPVSTICNTVLPSMTRSSKWSLFLRFPHQTLYVFIFLCRMCHMLCQSHSLWFDQPKIFGEEFKLWSTSLHKFLLPLVTSSLLGPKIFLSTQLSSNLSLCSSLNVRDQLSHAHKRRMKIRVLYILIFTFLDRKREGKVSGLTGNRHSLNLICS